MLLLDEDEDQIPAPPPPPPEKPAGKRRGMPVRFSLRPFLIAGGIAVAGGGLGVAGYWAMSLDMRDVIGLFDLADTRPQLQLDLAAVLKGAPGPALPSLGGAQDSSIQPVAPGGEAAGVGNLAPTPQFKPDLPARPAVPDRPDMPSLPLPAGVPAPPVPPGAVVPTGPAIPPGPPPSQSPLAGLLPAPVPAAALTALPPPSEPVLPAPRAAAETPSYAGLPFRKVKPRALPPVPVPDLLVKGLPVIAADGRASWKVYAAPFDTPKPKVAVIITGMGLDKDATEAAIVRLPQEVTLALSPYAGATDVLVRQARERGHEVMMGLAVEQSGFPARDPGPLGLLVSTPEAETTQRLNKTLSKAVGYVGVWAPDGPFTASSQMTLVLKTLKDRGLLYVGPVPGGEAMPPFAAVTVSLDVDLFREAIDARLAKAVAVAKEKGRAVVLVTPRPLVYDRLVRWFETLDQEGVILTPVGSVVTQGASKP